MALTAAQRRHMNRVIAAYNSGTTSLFKELKIILLTTDVSFKTIHERSHVSVTTLNNWVHHKTKFPRIDTLTRVAAALGYRISLEEV